MFHRHKKILYDKRFVVLIVAFLVIVIAAGIVKAVIFGKNYSSSIRDLLFPDRKAEISIIKILDKNCADCFNLDPVLNRIRSGHVTIMNERSLDREDTEAQKFIATYHITRLPTFLVTGEINRDPDLVILWKKFGQVVNGFFVFTRVFPPYVIAETGEIRGQFTVTYLTDKTCGTCYDVRRHDVALFNLGLVPREENSAELDISSEEGRSLIKKYTIQFVPTIILRGEVNEYAPLVEIWPTVGTRETDGAYVLRESGERIMNKFGAYKNLKTGKLFNVK